jgi:MATE family multidrug resistance protein
MNLNREILRLAIPSIFANITVPLVGMVDMAVAGHLEGTSAAALIGGITIGAMLFDLLYWNFGFLRVGTGGLTAQAYGREMAGQAGHDETNRILQRALRIAVLSGVTLIALQWVVIQLAFLFIDCSPEVQKLATQYFYIRIWAAPATLSLFAFKGWFIGMQDTVRPMTADLIVNGINIGASIVLGILMGFPGIALGTFLAQWSGFTYCVIAAHHKYDWHLSLSLSDLYELIPQRFRRGPEQEVSATERVSRQANIRFFALNRDLFLRSIGMIAVYIGFTVISARYGDVMLAVSAILMKLLMFFSYFTDGFAYAGEALTGKFIGEGSEEGVRSTVQQTFLWGMAMAGLFMLAYGAGGTPILRLMTEDTVVVDAGRQFLPWLLLMPLIGCPAFVWDGIFIGATASKDLRNSTLLCAVGFFAVWFAGERYTSTPETAIHLLMAAYFVHLAIRAAYLTVRYKKAIFSGISSQ